MGDQSRLGRNFSRSEFACKGDLCCNHSAPVDPVLIEGLQALRDRIKRPIRVLSGFRCRTHNAEVGGAVESFHTLGQAADITVDGLTPAELAAEAEKVPEFAKSGIGTYAGWLHVDTRFGGPARWAGK